MYSCRHRVCVSPFVNTGVQTHLLALVEAFRALDKME